MDDHTTLLDREIAPGVPGGSPVEPRGQESALDAERLERANLLRLGGEPRQAGVLEHVIEREQAPQEHFIGSGPAVADVLGAERPVDPAPAYRSKHWRSLRPRPRPKPTTGLWRGFCRSMGLAF